MHFHGGVVAVGGAQAIGVTVATLQGRATVPVLQCREPPVSSPEDDTPVPTRDIISRVS
jgi:hypothetical protein